MEKYSEQWTMNADGVIVHDEGKFYQVVKGQYGNPLIYQPTGGNVYLTLVGIEVLCEEETVYEDGVTPTKQWRVVRAALDNPNQPNLLGEPMYLGEGHSNTQRILGPADKYYLVKLSCNPDPSKYKLLPLGQIASSKDNFGKAAILMAIMAGEIIVPAHAN
ncbi:MAG: hypothetical protein LBG64_04065 [Pseudomonadales bacterium]|jgi:hypothetical protein|nr:hypothetical protein [Pseudomonadales bacterium]